VVCANRLGNPALILAHAAFGSRVARAQAGAHGQICNPLSFQHRLFLFFDLVILPLEDRKLIDFTTPA
jgi:hypothetical protein